MAVQAYIVVHGWNTENKRELGLLSQSKESKGSIQWLRQNKADSKQKLNTTHIGFGCNLPLGELPTGATRGEWGGLDSAEGYKDKRKNQLKVIWSEYYQP